jgi:hypothetical protein
MVRALTLLVLYLLLPAISQAAGDYTEAMYRRGLANQSTAPLFVLVRLVDPATHSDRATCVAAPFLLGAIHIERHIPYDEVGAAKAMEIALNQPDRRFTFKNAKARANVWPAYAPSVADTLRAALKDKTDEQLRLGLEPYNGDLHALYRNAKTYQNSPEKLQALCEVLLERGILVGQTDRVLGLYLEE